MKFGQVTKYKKGKIFSSKSYRKWRRETSSRPLFVFLKKAYYGVKASGLQLGSYISIALNLTYTKNKLYTILDYWYRDILNFDFLVKCLRIVSPPYFMYDFSRKLFLMLAVFYINWPNFNADCLYFLRYWSICVL